MAKNTKTTTTTASAHITAVTTELAERYGMTGIAFTAAEVKGLSVRKAATKVAKRVEQESERAVDAALAAKTTKTTKTPKAATAWTARAEKIAAARAANRAEGLSERDKRAIAKLNREWAATFAA